MPAQTPNEALRRQVIAFSSASQVLILLMQRNGAGIVPAILAGDAGVVAAAAYTVDLLIQHAEGLHVPAPCDQAHGHLLDILRHSRDQILVITDYSRASLESAGRAELAHLARFGDELERVRESLGL